MVGIPVITTNREYHKEFGSWSKETNPTLEQEYWAARGMPPMEVFRNLETRRLICVDKHSMSNWSRKLVQILTRDLVFEAEKIFVWKNLKSINGSNNLNYI